MEIEKGRTRTAKQNKISDTDELARHSRADDYWREKGFRKFYKRFRDGADIPPTLFPQDGKQIRDKFRYRAFEFGNWVTIEDRYNYLAALFIASYDLNKAVRFNYNIGLSNVVGIAFGSRGSGASLAHFSPHTFFINLNRYSKDDPKEFSFSRTGGAGSLAHEYGHALDYFFGSFIEHDRDSRSLSGGRSTKIIRKNEWHESTMRYDMAEVIMAIQSQESFYRPLREKLGKTNDYWIRQNELFARAFEQWVEYKLKQAGITNTLLTSKKYDGIAYMSDAELKPVIPKIDTLINGMRLRLPHIDTKRIQEEYL